MIFHKDNFRRIREKSGLTFREVGAAVGVTETTAQRWANHPTICPRPTRIAKLAALLGCREDDLAIYGNGRMYDVSPQELRELAKLMRQLALKFEMIAGKGDK